jgi:hypothetical protein
MATKLIDAATSTVTGSSLRVTSPPSSGAQFTQRTFQATGLTTAGAGAVSVAVQVSNSNLSTDWLTLGTISLVLGTTQTSDGITSNAAWEYVRGVVSSISGTGAVVNLWMGV